MLHCLSQTLHSLAALLPLTAVDDNDSSLVPLTTSTAPSINSLSHLVCLVYTTAKTICQVLTREAIFWDHPLTLRDLFLHSDDASVGRFQVPFGQVLLLHLNVTVPYHSSKFGPNLCARAHTSPSLASSLASPPRSLRLPPHICTSTSSTSASP
ncbi:uncharacterized protein MEPE_02440 [Melanopsichium pennsylvanicum]|uniref:Uncharacterized protein n=2 Tax=Melanopsichium pennsylvanicum TaxID=63383 RepID=A0AAJ4XKE5_9BASI|nr:uncharacterized protein BN887_06241 [Melanopsichium pennsylvanicum 4]SNX83733.1 uncharacterized protein MEPE_02440 [Melanopsichium pennsylvanicum]